MARGALFTSDIRLWLQLMSTPIVGSLCKLLPAFRSRMLGNPRFLMVLGIEEAIGVAAKWSAEKSSRKDNFWKAKLVCYHWRRLYATLVYRRNAPLRAAYACAPERAHQQRQSATQHLSIATAVRLALGATPRIK